MKLRGVWEGGEREIKARENARVCRSSEIRDTHGMGLNSEAMITKLNNGKLRCRQENNS